MAASIVNTGGGNEVKSDPAIAPPKIEKPSAADSSAAGDAAMTGSLLQAKLGQLYHEPRSVQSVVDFYYRVFKRSSHYRMWKAGVQGAQSNMQHPPVLNGVADGDGDGGAAAATVVTSAPTMLDSSHTIGPGAAASSATGAGDVAVADDDSGVSRILSVLEEQ